jgi:hypothetical protein
MSCTSKMYDQVYIESNKENLAFIMPAKFIVLSFKR